MIHYEQSVKLPDEFYNGRIPNYARPHSWTSEQIERIRCGLTVGDVSVTGAHYFFLNFIKIRDHHSGDYVYPKYHKKQADLFVAYEESRRSDRHLVIEQQRITGVTVMLCAISLYEIVIGHHSAFIAPSGKMQFHLSRTLDSMTAMMKSTLSFFNYMPSGAFKYRQGSELVPIFLSGRAVGKSIIDHCYGRGTLLLDGFDDLVHLYKFLAHRKSRAIIAFQASTVRVNGMGWQELSQLEQFVLSKSILHRI